MDLYNTSISSPSSSSDADAAAAADEKKADARRAERAQSFQQSLNRGLANSAAAGGLLSSGTPAPQPPSARQSAAAPKAPAGQSDPSAFLSPALLRLQSEGYPLTASETGKPVVPVEPCEGRPQEGKSQGKPETLPQLPGLTRDSKPAQPERTAPPEPLIPKPVERDRDTRSRRESQTGAKSQTSRSAPDPRYLVGSVPVPSPQDFKAALAAPAAGPTLPSPEVLQQIVEFATIHHGKDGAVEFQLGLAGDVLGGARIKLSAYGNRRVGLSVKGGRGENPIGGEEVARLIEALKQRDVEVVDVTLA